MFLQQLDEFTLLHQPHRPAAQPSLAYGGPQFLHAHTRGILESNFAGFVRRQHPGKEFHHVGNLFRRYGMRKSGISLDGVVLGPTLLYHVLSRFLGHTELDHGIGFTVTVQDGRRFQPLRNFELLGRRQISAHHDDAGQLILRVRQLHAGEQAEGAALAESSQHHPAVGQAGALVLGAEDGPDGFHRRVDAPAVFVGPLVEADNVVPRRHGHPHVHGDGLGGGGREDEFGVRQTLGQMLGDIGKALGAVPQPVADDDEGRLVGLVGRADRDGAVAGPFDDGG
mmetsp:Transcript_3486/g.9931  ORF Transcript_3486/g.9931 Transcript_3486/m.9931 type:complete len:282 (-) Transcript_3486:190-1035(-)